MIHHLCHPVLPGYDYLRQHKRTTITLSILKANTILHPNSAILNDSYAEALMMIGDLKSSVANYQKAVETAAKNDDRDLEFYKKNLETAKDKLKAEK